MSYLYRIVSQKLLNMTSHSNKNQYNKTINNLEKQIVKK